MGLLLPRGVVQPFEILFSRDDLGNAPAAARADRYYRQRRADHDPDRLARR